MAKTYEPIATYTVSGAGQASYTFSSIPSTYTDLILVGSAIENAGNDDMKLNFNGDTNSNLSATYLYGNGTSALSARRTSVVDVEVDWTGIGTGQGQTVIHIMNYANTSTYKTALARTDFAGKGTNTAIVLWRSTAAISSVKVLLPNQLFMAGTTFTLYGIKAA